MALKTDEKEKQWLGRLEKQFPGKKAKGNSKLRPGIHTCSRREKFFNYFFNPENFVDLFLSFPPLFCKFQL